LKLFIKNIVSLSSLNFARSELDRIGLQGVSIDINEISTDENISPLQYDRLYLILQQAGIVLHQDKKDILVQKIKNIVMEVVYHSEEPLVDNLSTHLTEKLHQDYTYMSNLFSATQHTTIEKFYICHKIERVKELLIYEKMSVTDIAHKMCYSSLAHLSGQFKKVTGLTTSQFKQQCEDGDLPPERC
jgi:YesN/AraC family two-component response regulator